MTKEQYLAIVAAWRNYIKDGKHKKYKVPYGAWIRKPNSYNGDWVDDYGYKWETNLKAIHHYIYAVIRKKDVTKTFSEESINQILSSLRWVHNKAKNQATDPYTIKIVSELLEPFGGTLSQEEFAKLSF